MEPLARLCDQTAAAGQFRCGVDVVPLTQPDQSISHSGRERQIRRTIQLRLQELMKALLPALNIGKALIRLKIQGLLKRTQPIEQQLELLAVQPPGWI